jgi:hypothetical protein
VCGITKEFSLWLAVSLVCFSFASWSAKVSSSSVPSVLLLFSNLDSMTDEMTAGMAMEGEENQTRDNTKQTWP